MNLILILLISQALYTAGDLLARYNMAASGFTLSNFLSPWFTMYFLLRTVAMFGQLYLFSQFALGKNAAMFGAASIILANGLGFLLLGEVLTPTQYIGVMLAITAFIVLAFFK